MPYYRLPKSDELVLCRFTDLEIVNSLPIGFTPSCSSGPRVGRVSVCKIRGTSVSGHRYGVTKDFGGKTDRPAVDSALGRRDYTALLLA